ncbi:major strawberry allergen Fra a 1-3-like [Salvia miltiorrhiza]|uniref:major strawberry allergen Fra a 1-3-like n=1 Tax=Salvia miltiorrhiza TaxID=226208 RepID=UPI0025AD631E|nr:major strawberry allergen Fra a 1-3-like [Salvia miltiorrhiza]
MAPIIVDQEISCSLPPAKLFKAFVVDADELMPKVIPNFFKSFETVEGDGGVGSIKLITFTGEGGDIKPAKHKIVEIDEEKQVFKYDLVEGGILGEDLEFVSYVFKFETSGDGGCTIKIASTYHPKSDEHHHTIKEIIERSKEVTKGFVNAIQAHLHGHT